MRNYILGGAGTWWTYIDLAAHFLIESAEHYHGVTCTMSTEIHHTIAHIDSSAPFPTLWVCRQANHVPLTVLQALSLSFSLIIIVGWGDKIQMPKSVWCHSVKVAMRTKILACVPLRCTQSDHEVRLFVKWMYLFKASAMFGQYLI